VIPLFRRGIALALASCAVSAAAQNFKLVVPYPPGGTTDIVARPIAKGLQQALGQPVVIENRPGAGGNIGMEYVAKAEPDGRTLAISSVSTLAIAPSLYKSLPYDVLRDLAPVTRIAAVPNVLIVNPSVPAKSVKELIAYAKAHPGALRFGSAGSGTTVHLSAELFKSMAGIEMEHVPYKGAAPAMIDLLGDRVQLMFDFLSSALPQIKAGKVRALGVTGPRRSPLLPEVPTIAEAGVPGYEVYAAFGVLAPGGTPTAVVHRLRDEIAKVIRTREMQDILAAQGAEPIGDTPEQFAASLKAEIDKWAAVVKASGAQVD
jgi:tripartite-type tricarboxylate transporter receptor subunit TctC